MNHLIHPSEARPTAWLRLGLLALTAAGIAGTAAELAFTRHWDSAVQLIPWACLAVLAAGLAAVAIRPSPGRVRAARVLATIAAVGGLYGVIDHVAENHAAAPLDASYGPKWESMSAAAQWWAAATGGVGPSPPLAPAMLAQIGVCLALATVGHPTTGAGQRGERRSAGGVPAEEAGQEAAAGPLAGRAGTALRLRHSGQHLLDVGAAAGPGCLAARGAGLATAHGR